MSATEAGPKQEPQIPDWWKWPLPPLGGIERLPTFFGERQIKFRSPFSMPGELKFHLADLATSPSTAFPEATFLQNSDKPMEVHRMIARVTALDEDGEVILLPEDLAKSLWRTVRVRIQDVTKNQLITKNAQLLSDLLNDRGVWEWYDPYTMSRSEGFEVLVEFLDFAPKTIAVWGGQASETITDLRLEITFEGYLIVIAPPTNER